MAKIKTIYSCTECGATSPKWQGQCPGCNDWNTLVETVAEKAPTNSRFESLAPAAKLQNLSEIEAREVERIALGIARVPRVEIRALLAGRERWTRVLGEPHRSDPLAQIADPWMARRAPAHEQPRVEIGERGGHARRAYYCTFTVYDPVRATPPSV